MLRLLDDECLVAGGRDEAFAAKLYQQFDLVETFGAPPPGRGGNGDGAAAPTTSRWARRFAASPAQRAAVSFVVEHYAGRVQYSARGFVEKNRDTLFPEVCCS